jgi:hypothetical protein
MPRNYSRLARVVRVATLVAVSSCTLAARAAEPMQPAKFDDQSLRQRLDALRDRLGRLNPLNPFGGGVLQPAPGMPRIVIPPQRPPEFFMRKVPVPTQDRSNWVPQTINGQTFYLVPCHDLRSTRTLIHPGPTTARSAG